jgi:hypothetical protein
LLNLKNCEEGRVEVAIHLPFFILEINGLNFIAAASHGHRFFGLMM